MSHCTNCGQPIAPAQNFCGKCGQQIGSPPPIIAQTVPTTNVTPNPRRYGGGCIILAGLILVIGAVSAVVWLTMAQRTTYEVTLNFASDAAIARHDPSAQIITDLDSLPAPTGGGRIVSAARFEPSGLEIPDGLGVTWPLAAPRNPDSTLWITALDETQGQWLGTGELATVSKSGKSATGTVYHFSVIGLTDKEPEKNEDRPRVYYDYVRNEIIEFKTRTPAEVRKGKLDAVMEVYNAWNVDPKKPPVMSPKKMKEIYAAGDFDTVKTLIEDGKISLEHSLQMADLRIVMITDLLTHICEQNGWKVFRSDSGNQSAGMKSDIDQTIYVYRYDTEKKEWMRYEDGDSKLAQLFNSMFPRHKLAGLPLEHLDIATIAGKDKFPDPRRTSQQLDAEGLRPFKIHAETTMQGLRLTPGAYTYCGPVVQQMQLRAEEAILRNLRLDTTDPGQLKQSRPVHPELAKRLGPNGLNDLVLMEIGPGEDGKYGIHEVSQEKAMKVMFDGLPPQLVRGHAYDAAVANYLIFMHHLTDAKPATKYHLRAFDNGQRVLSQLAGRSSGVDYENLKTDAEKLKHLREVLGPDVDAKTLNRWKLTLDASAAMRLAHKNSNLSSAEVEKALRPIAEYLAGKDPGNWRQHVEAARGEYDRVCQEFMIHSIVETAHERMLDWVDLNPDDSKRSALDQWVDADEVRKSLGLEGKQNDAKWDKIKHELFKNHADLAELQLLRSFRELTELHHREGLPDVVDQMFEKAKQRGLSDVQIKRLTQLRQQANSLLFKPRLVLQYRKMYMRYYRSVAEHKVGEYIKNIRERVYAQSRMFAPETRADAIRFFRKHRAAGVTSRFIRNAVFDYGNFDGVLQVVRVWSETGGDPDRTIEAIQREALSALPIIGQIYTVYRAPTTGEKLKTGAVVTVCMIVPAAGIAALTYSIGEASISLYKTEFSKPLSDVTADVLYHGFAGPSLISYDQQPPEFTKADATQLDEHRAAMARLKDATSKSGRDELAKHVVMADRLSQKKKVAEFAEAAKRRRKHWEGSAIFGTGQQLVQKRFAGPNLLDAVEPIIFYANSPFGEVDFTTQELNAEQKERLKEVQRITDAQSADPLTHEALLAIRQQFETQQMQYERAQRFLAQAKVNHELMHRIKRDSIWPWVIKGGENRKMNDGRAYVNQWYLVNKNAINDGLRKFNLISGDEVPEVALKEMGYRLTDDVERSRDLWKANQYTVQQQRAATEKRTENRKGALFGEALMEAAVNPPNVFSADTNDVLTKAGIPAAKALSLVPVADAIRQRHVPYAPPKVKIGMRMVEVGGKKFEFRPDIRVIADPNIYRPPYSYAVYALDASSTKSAIASSAYKGLPLGKGTTDYLRKHLQSLAQKKSVVPAMLTFVFCDDCAIPHRVVPETTNYLPQLRQFDIPGEKRKGYLFGSAGIGPEPIEPPDEPTPSPDQPRVEYVLTFQSQVNKQGNTRWATSGRVAFAPYVSRRVVGGNQRTKFSNPVMERYLIKMECNGQTRYFYRKGPSARTRHRRMNSGSWGTWAGHFNLSDGVHPVRATVICDEGSRVIESAVGVKYKDFGFGRTDITFRNQLDKFLGEYREELAKNPQARVPGIVISSGESYLLELNNNGYCSPSEVVAMGKTLTEWDADRTRPNGSWRIKSFVVEVLRKVGSQDAYDLAKKIVQSVGDEGYERGLAQMQIHLAHLAISSKGDIGGSISHLNKALAYYDADKYFQKPESRKAFIDTWPEPIGASNLP